MLNFKVKRDIHALQLEVIRLHSELTKLQDDVFNMKYPAKFPVGTSISDFLILRSWHGPGIYGSAIPIRWCYEVFDKKKNGTIAYIEDDLLARIEEISKKEGEQK